MVGARPRFTAFLSALAAALATTLVVALGVASADAEERFITLASTTSTANSGLFDQILPKFTARTGITVRVVAVGTGAALRLGERGDADVVMVHARAAEDRFVAAGYGVERRDVMYNDFVIVGPGADPAGVRGLSDAPEALGRIAAARARFVSRGDDSGTHKAELRLWVAAGTMPESRTDRWYREAGAGMGATLNTAVAMGAYALVDRGTWLSFANHGGLVLLVEGDARLRNPYGVILVNPARHPHVRAEEGRAFIAWLTSSEGQSAIAGFTVGGELPFIPDAVP